MDQEASEELVDLIKKQIDKNLAVPDDSHIVVESGKEGPSSTAASATRPMIL